MIFIRFAIALIVLSSVVVKAHAQQFGQRSGAYFCTVKMAAGLGYNAPRQKWEGWTFKPEGDFVLRLKFKSVRKDEYFTADEYEVTITDHGKNVALPCTNAVEQTSVDQWGSLRCDAVLYNFKFNFKSNRFLRVYSVGYIDGSDEGSDTPEIAGGICTKIE